MFWGLAIRNIFCWLPDKPYVKLMWWLRMGYPLNLKNPVTFNEKLQWLKLYSRDPLHTILADKYAVREYISKQIGSKYLLPVLGIYESVAEIKWDKLPDKFVLKCNHDSGSRIICKDKSKLDKKAAIKKLNKRMRNNTTYNMLREWPYKNIRRKIICEKYMADKTGELIDYKFFCFNGEPKVLLIFKGRFSGNPTVDFYDIHFNHLNINIQPYSQSQEEIKKPNRLKEMVELSKILSRDFTHIRVDFYEISGQVFFGELTFFSGSGFHNLMPKSIDTLWGSWINIPSFKN